MEAALRALAEQTGAQVLFTPDAVSGLRSQAVRGRMATGEALERAVAGRGLEIETIGPGVFVVRRPPTRQHAKAAEPMIPVLSREDVIVTGQRPGGMARRTDTPFAVTVIGAPRLDALNSSALADIIALTPGFWVESSGGEASNNVRARGVPLDGYASIAVFEDGLPVQHDTGLGFLNPDQVFRPGLSVARVEVVRGGPASIMASQAPGGLVSVVNRPPPETFGADLKMQTADFGGWRLDLFGGGPVGSAAASLDGFWRIDDGVRDTGFEANRGGAARLAVAAHWRGVDFNLALKRVDDRVAFFLPVPLRLNEAGRIEEIDGFDAGRGALAGPDLVGFDALSAQAGGAFAFKIEDGTRVRLNQATFKADWALGENWTAQFGLRGRMSQTDRNGLFPRTPQAAFDRSSQALALARSLFPQAEEVGFVVAADGSPWSAADEALVIDAIASRVSAPLDEVLGSLTLSGEGAVLGAGHRWTLGLYGARSELGYRRGGSTIVLEARENARRLDIVARDAGGAALGSITQSGVLRFGAQYDNARASQDALAAFATWELSPGPRWTLDGGLRWDSQNQEGWVELARLDNLGGPTLADDAVLRGAGEFRRFSARSDALNATLGARYALTPGASVFARASHATRLPSVSDFYGDPTGAGANTAPTSGLDLGLALERPGLALHVVAFQTSFEGFPFNETVIDPLTGAVQSSISFASSRTQGLEIEAHLEPTGWLDVDASLTLQDPAFTDFLARSVADGGPLVEDFSGRQLVRVPRLMARVAPVWRLPSDAGEAGLAVEHFGERFADAANSVRLPPYTELSGHVALDLTDRTRLTLSGSNLTDALGLTEGNPRTGQRASLDADQSLFTARPIFGRTFRAALTVHF